MSQMGSIQAARLQLQSQLFPEGVPKLWCPSLSFFQAAHRFDREQLEEHLQAIAPWVRAILVPGSTGEGWQMSDDEIDRLIDLVEPMARSLRMKVLIGVLKTDLRAMVGAIERLQTRVDRQTIIGFTVCPPQGKNKTQGEIEQSLREILQFDLPMALYQLPQVTQNEMEPETVQRLALDHANFLLFKDTSGEDRVASSGLDFGGVFFLRGSELGGYARWLRSAGGGYDGFLLSSANVFAKPLMQVIEQVDQGRFAEAESLSKRIEAMVGGAFAKVASHSKGNPFTNANKAMLYWKNGRFNAMSPAPMLIDGERLPLDLLHDVRQILPQDFFETNRADNF